MTRRFTVLVALLIASLLVPLSDYPGHARAEDLGTPVAGIACGGPNGDGLIVYLDVQQAEKDGDVQSALVVFAPDGAELYRVPVQSVPTFFPLYVGCTAIVNGGDDQPMLFDPAKGQLLTLSVPEDFGDSLYPLNTWQRSERGERWAILSDGVIGHALLVDTATGDVTDLVAIVNERRGDNADIVVPLSVVMTPDESSLLFATDRDTWIIPTATPGDARLVSDATPGRVALSDDGKRIAFTAEKGDDAYEVVTENLDGSGRQTLTKAERSTTVSWVPKSDGKHLLVIDLLGGPNSVRLFDDGRGRPIDVNLQGNLAGQPIYSSSGRRVLLRVDHEGIGWVWIDLDTMKGRQLPELDGYPFPYTGLRSGLQSLTFYPSDQPSVEPGAVMRGLDLTTGEVSDLLTFDVEETYVGIPTTSPFGVSADGRYVIVNDLGENYPGFWLLDAAQGTATEYDGRLAQSFSPDGSRLIVAGPSDSDDNRVWQTLIMSVDGQDIVTLAESFGRGGLWLPA